MSGPAFAVSRDDPRARKGNSFRRISVAFWLVLLLTLAVLGTSIGLIVDGLVKQQDCGEIRNIEQRLEHELVYQDCRDKAWVQIVVGLALAGVFVVLVWISCCAFMDMMCFKRYKTTRYRKTYVPATVGAAAVANQSQADRLTPPAEIQMQSLNSSRPNAYAAGGVPHPQPIGAQPVPAASAAAGTGLGASGYESSLPLHQQQQQIMRMHSRHTPSPPQARVPPAHPIPAVPQYTSVLPPTPVPVGTRPAPPSRPPSPPTQALYPQLQPAPSAPPKTLGAL